MNAQDTLFYTLENWLTEVISYGHVYNVTDSGYFTAEFTINMTMKKAQESFSTAGWLFIEITALWPSKWKIYFKESWSTDTSIL